MLKDRIESKLRDALAPLHLEVVNESSMHNVPRGSEAHFKVVVVSERFARFVERHGFTNMRLTPSEEFVWDPLARGPPDPKPTSA